MSLSFIVHYSLITYMLHYKLPLFSCVAVSFLFAGCGERLPPGMPKLYKTTITIVQDGNPLVGASVVAISDNFETTPWTSGGVTDESGSVELKTQGRYRGMPAGTYLVTVSKIEGPLGLELPQKPNTDEEIREYDRIQKQIESNSFHIVDEKYMKQDSTPLKLEIKGTTRERFDVSPAVKVKVPLSVSG